METEIIPHSGEPDLSREWWRFFTEKKAGRLLGMGVRPLAWANGGCGSVRRKLYSAGVMHTKKLPCAVISVGNLTMGGTGKTPAVISIVRTLTRKGLRAAVVSRGYRGKYAAETAIVSDGENLLMSPEEAGDEPYMIARALDSAPVIVGKDRYSAGLLAWEKFGAQAVVLDDGYQQLGLVKDLNILLVNWQSSKGELRLFPLGALRESLTQVSRADIILYTMYDEKQKHPPPIALAEGAPAFRSKHKPVGLRSIVDDRSLSLESAKGKKALAFCGIARPGYFLNTLQEVGVKVVDFVAYPDHHHFTGRDLAALAERTKSACAEMAITTEKDAVKIEGRLTGDPPFLALSVDLSLLEHQKEWEWFLTGAVKT